MQAHTSIQKLVIIDPSLRDMRGHHYTLTNSISEGALKAGLKVLWYTNIKFKEHTAKQEIKVRPLFKRTMYDSDSAKRKKLKNKIFRTIYKFYFRLSFIRIIISKFQGRLPSSFLSSFKPFEATKDSFTSVLLKTLKQDKIGKNDHVIFHTCDGHTYREVLRLAQSPDFLMNPPFIHLCTPYDESTMPAWGSGLSLDRVIDLMKQMGVLNRLIFIYAENKLLSKYLEKKWSIAIPILNLPAPPLKMPRTDSNSKAISVGYLGPARIEKGFLYLPYIIKSLIKDSELCSMTQVTIQSTPQIIGRNHQIKKAIQKLKKVSTGQIRIINEVLSIDEYYSLLNKTNVLLLLYDPKRYKYRGSSLAVEAVCAGKVVITFPETLPAYIAGSAAVTVKNFKQVTEKLKEIINDFDYYNNRAKVRAVEYKKQHSSLSYIQTIKKVEKQPIELYPDTYQNEKPLDYNHPNKINKNANRPDRDLIFPKLIRNTCAKDIAKKLAKINSTHTHNRLKTNKHE